MFQYHCPDCHTAHDLHEPRCSFSQLDRHEYEKAYVDIISTLSAVICSLDRWPPRVSPFFWPEKAQMSLVSFNDAIEFF